MNNSNFHHRYSRAETRYKYEVLSEEKDSCTKPRVLREPATKDLADETTLCVSRTGSREQDSWRSLDISVEARSML